MGNLLAEYPGETMADEAETDDGGKGKGKSIRFSETMYNDIRRCAGVQKKKITVLAAELIRAPLEARKSKLAAELVKFDRDEAAAEARAEQAERKLKNERG